MLVIEPSLQGLDGLANVPANIYFGIGLCNKHVVSQGVPVDVLSMILLSEMLGLEKQILVADSHARTNGFNNSEITSATRRTYETTVRAIDNLALQGWNVVLASEIDGQRDYVDFLRALDETNEYVARELTDMHWFAMQEIQLKVGWAMNGSRDSSETSFDRKFTALFPGKLSFIYLQPGRTCNSKIPRSAPYFCGDKQSRVLLEQGENVSLKLAGAREMFGDQGTNGYVNSLKNLTRLYDRVIEPTERGPIEDRVQQIVERCVR